MRPARTSSSASRPSPSPSTWQPAAPPPAWTPPPSPWHSPVPYLFGGLAAMLGLIALALLILACSYWKLNSYLGDAETPSSSSGDGEEGGGFKSPAVACTASPGAFAGLVAVVMAGDKAPTFLAAPVVHRVVHDVVVTVPTAAGGEGSSATETEGEENSKKAGAADSGGTGAVVVDNAERGDDDRTERHV